MGQGVRFKMFFKPSSNINTAALNEVIPSVIWSSVLIPAYRWENYLINIPKFSMHPFITSDIYTINIYKT